MSRGALCWMTAPTRGSLNPTSSDEVATMMSAAESTPVSWDVVRATRIWRFIRPSFCGRVPGLSLRIARPGLVVRGRAQVGQYPPAGDAIGIVTLGVTQVVVQTVDHVEVVGEGEGHRTEDACLVVEDPRDQHRGLDGGRQQRRSRDGIATEDQTVFATGGQHVRTRRGDRLDLRSIDAGQGGHEVPGVTERRGQADEHGTRLTLLPIGIAPPPQRQRDLGTRDTGVGVHLVEQNQTGSVGALPPEHLG